MSGQGFGGITTGPRLRRELVSSTAAVAVAFAMSAGEPGSALADGSSGATVMTLDNPSGTTLTGGTGGGGSTGAAGANGSLSFAGGGSGLSATDGATGGTGAVVTGSNGGGQAFLTAGVPIARDAVVAAADVDWQVARNTTVDLTYTGQAGDRPQDHGIKGSLTYRW